MSSNLFSEGKEEKVYMLSSFVLTNLYLYLLLDNNNKVVLKWAHNSLS